jgi:hypothetical protein
MKTIKDTLEVEFQKTVDTYQEGNLKDAIKIENEMA